MRLTNPCLRRQYIRSDFVRGRSYSDVPGAALMFDLVDRDSAQWKLEEKIVQRRRNLFWELFIFEMLHVRPLPLDPRCG